MNNKGSLTRWKPEHNFADVWFFENTRRPLMAVLPSLKRVDWKESRSFGLSCIFQAPMFVIFTPFHMGIDRLLGFWMVLYSGSDGLWIFVCRGYLESKRWIDGEEPGVHLIKCPRQRFELVVIALLVLYSIQCALRNLFSFQLAKVRGYSFNEILWDLIRATVLLNSFCIIKIWW